MEAFHALRAVVYVQKVYSKCFASLECLGYLAALDHNHHVHQPFKSDAQGQPKLKKRFNERTKTFTVDGVRVGKTYGFVPALLHVALHNAATETPVACLDASLDPRTISRHVSGLSARSSLQLFSGGVARVESVFLRHYFEHYC